jgi:hypothetical protein
MGHDPRDAMPANYLGPELETSARRDPRWALSRHLADAHGVMLTRAEFARTTLAGLALLDPCGDVPPPAAGDLGTDAEGYRVRRSGGMDFRVTACCGKDATTADGDDPALIVCRRCKRPVDEAIALRPELPYTDAGGRVTARAAAPGAALMGDAAAGGLTVTFTVEDPGGQDPTAADLSYALAEIDRNGFGDCVDDDAVIEAAARAYLRIITR